MKAGLRQGPQKVNCVELTEPGFGPDQVLVRVKAVGICGSDINRVAEDDPKWDSVVLGHEFAGVVEQTGQGVIGVSPGQRVSVAPLMPCHHCVSCLRGEYSLCKSYSFIGSRVHGAFAELVAVPAENLVRLPDGLSFELAAMLEPVTVCLHPILRLGNLLGKSAVVTGAGTIGLLAVQILKAMGTKIVIVSDIVDEKLQLARDVGADRVVNPTQQSLEEIVQQECDEGGADLVFESSGSSPAKKSAVTITKGRGTILLVGTSPRDVTFEAERFEQITRKELNLVGSWMNYSAPFPGAEWTTAVWLLENGKIDAGRLISHRYPLCDIAEAYKMIFDGREPFTKVMITP